VGGPHQGVFGVPHLGWVIPAPLLDLLTANIYADWVQKNYSFAGYWKDPFKLDEYLAKVKFLPDINNERPTKNPVYRQRMMRLKNFVMVMSSREYIVIPRESNHFGYYKPKNTFQIQDMTQTEGYINDWIGLRTLNESGRLHLLMATCIHQQYPDEEDKEFFMSKIIPFLNVTTSEHRLVVDE
jgi:palmitoyl-protein thioesterase